MKAIHHDKVKTPNYINNIASGKIDGFRATVQENPETGLPAVYTCSLKLHVNKHVQFLFARPEYLGFDGELVVDGDFHACSSALRKHEGKPNVTFWVFDYISQAPFKERFLLLQMAFATIPDDCPAKLLPQYNTPTGDIKKLNNFFVEKGFEGVILRDPDAAYREGRPGKVNPCMVKYKHFEEGEAIIVGCEPLMVNHNEQFVNEMGATVRSHKAEGKIADHSRIGSFILRSHRFKETFRCGSGLTDSFRRQYMSMGEDIIGRAVRFKHQPFGSTDDRPRTPIFLKLIK